MNPRRLRKCLRVGLVLLGLALAWGAPAYGVELTVQCSNPKAVLKSITQVLAFLPKQGPNTIHVSGACNENVIIDGFENLALVANAGASINDPTPSTADDNDVIDITRSRVVHVEGFTINGGLEGIACFIFSECELFNNTVQGAADSGVFIGRQSFAELQGGVLQGNVQGLTAIHGAEVVVFGITIQNNGGFGAYVGDHSLLRITNGGIGVTTIQNNAGAGVEAEINSTVFVGGNAANITGNPGVPGVDLVDASVLRMQGGGNAITNNGEGVHVGDSSLARISASTTMSGNTGGDVQCFGFFSIARGKFNCSNP